MDNERYTRGSQRLAEIDGEGGQHVIDALKDVAPDLATVAGLVALGHAQPQLKVHVNGALNVGCTPAEIVEVIIQMALYAGFPAAVNGAFTARQVFAERGFLPVS
jgi:4-carboxymuconolactone decarboxylase